MQVARRLLPFAAFSLGGLGVIVCAAAILGVWLAGSRLNRATENVFAQVDRFFVTARDNVLAAKQRVQNAKSTSVEIEQNLKAWAKSRASDRLTFPPALAERAGRLVSGLNQADQWLEFSQSSIQLVQQVLKSLSSSRATLQGQAADRLLEELASLRVQLKEVTESVDRIRARTAEVQEDKPLADGFDRTVQLALRAIATLSSIDSRIGALERRLSTTRTEAQHLETRIRRWIRVGTVGAALLILWMAAGQISLCCHGWRRLRASRGAGT